MKGIPAFSRMQFGWLAIALCVILGPHLFGQSTTPSTVPGLTLGVYQLLSGLWEEKDHPVTSGRISREFSWGKAGVVPNWGFVFELGTIAPYIQVWGEPLVVKEIRVVSEGRIEIDVEDQNIDGAGAFKRVLFSARTGDTAVIDFERKDGSLYGASVYERRYGPPLK